MDPKEKLKKLEEAVEELKREIDPPRRREIQSEDGRIRYKENGDHGDFDDYGSP